MPTYIVLSSIVTFISFMRAKTVILNTGFGQSVIPCAVLSPSWHHHMCRNYKILWLENFNGNLTLILSTVILRIQFGSAFYKTFFLIAVYFNLLVLICTRLINDYVRFFVVFIDNWNSPKAQYRFSETLQISLLQKDWNVWKISTANRL